MNIPLLRKVQQVILAEPLKFDMTEWFKDDKMSPCGTTACIAGHAIAIAKGCKSLKIASDESPNNPRTLGMEVLNLEEYEANRLFYRINWPVAFYNDYVSADTAVERALVASARIDHFIKTEGRE